MTHTTILTATTTTVVTAVTIIRIIVVAGYTNNLLSAVTPFVCRHVSALSHLVCL